MTSIYIGTPAFASMVSLPYMTSLIKTIQELHKCGILVHTDFIGNESLITRARNNIVARFMESKCDYLMFIDADITFEAEHIKMLIADDKDIIGGIYPLKRYEIENNLERAIKESKNDKGINYPMLKSKLVNYAVNMLDNVDSATAINGVMEVKHIATGFMMIKRGVIEKMIREYPKMKLKQASNFDKYGERYYYNFFDTDVDKKGYYLSEDYAFCKRAKNIDYKIYADIRIPLCHSGTTTYQGHYGLSLLDINQQ